MFRFRGNECVKIFFDFCVIIVIVFIKIFLKLSLLKFKIVFIFFFLSLVLVFVYFLVFKRFLGIIIVVKLVSFKDFFKKIFVK